MKLSAPLYGLKRDAKRLSRNENIPHHQALDRIAAREGFSSWSLLASRMAAKSPARTIANALRPGDLLLVAARPGQGKTLLGLEIAIEAMKAGSKSFFFSLEYTQRHMLDRFRDLQVDPAGYADRFVFESSDSICASHINSVLEPAPSGTLAVIDYLQLLDQKRSNPDLAVQVRDLKLFARERGLILIFISQIDRAFDMSGRTMPGTEDIRLPNPVEIAMFDYACFLHEGKVRFGRLNLLDALRNPHASKDRDFEPERVSFGGRELDL